MQVRKLRREFTAVEDGLDLREFVQVMAKHLSENGGPKPPDDAGADLDSDDDSDSDSIDSAVELDDEDNEVLDQLEMAVTQVEGSELHPFRNMSYQDLISNLCELFQQIDINGAWHPWRRAEAVAMLFTLWTR